MARLGEDAKEEGEKEKVMEVFVGATIVELKKETLEDHNPDTIKENISKRNCWVAFYVEVNSLFII